MDKRYAGIGSRKTPEHIQKQMTIIASFLEAHGYILHSGGADGADQAFESGVKKPEMKKIFLPWRNFNKNPSPLFEVSKEALTLAEEYHPAWYILPQAAKRLMARNGYQVLGETLDNPVDFVICYTPTGKAEGGTGQAIRIADQYKIPIFNLYYKKDIDQILYWFESEKVCFRKKSGIESWTLM